jgi:hypothetical protein
MITEGAIILWGISIPVALYVAFKTEYEVTLGELIILIIMAPLIASYFLLVTLMDIRIKKGKPKPSDF